jgi:VWFA-related protein
MSLPRGRIASTRYPVPMNPLPGHAAPTVHFPSRLSAIAAALGTLLLLGQMGGAQSAPPPGQTIRVDTQLVLLDALVQNKKTGLTVDTLSAKDFQISEDGVPQTISYFSRDQLPLSVVLLFDMTETVHAALGPLSQAGLEVLGHLKREDEVAVMIFSSRTELLQGFTTNRPLAAEAIKTASWMADVEGTFLDEDMFEAVDQVAKAKPGTRRVLLWLTDGTANQENAFTRATIGQHSAAHLHSQPEAMMRLFQSGAVVALLIDRTAETTRAIATSGMAGTRLGDFDQYAKATGGPILSTTTKDAAGHLSLLIDQIRSRYTLGYKPVRVEPEGKFCKLGVQLSPELHKQGFVILARTGYYR